MNWGHFFKIAVFYFLTVCFILVYFYSFHFLFFFTHDFFRYAPASYLKSTGSYALIAVVVVAVFIVTKIEFRDNSLKNYLILYARRKE